MAAFVVASRADESVVGEIRGSGTTTTGIFKVQDRWEVRWNAFRVVSVAVMAPDGTIVAGAAGVLRGSLFVPQGGRYYFKISDGTGGAIPPDRAVNAPNSPEPVFAWHLQIVELGTSVTGSQALTVYTPYFIMPEAAVTPSPQPPPEPPAPPFTPAEAHAIVVVKGDNAQGYGFLVKSSDGTFVATHLSLLANNPHVQIFNDTGTVIPTLTLKAATDRDLAWFAIKDDSYSYLTPATDPKSDVAVGDRIYIPSASHGSSNQMAKVLTLTPGRIEYAETTRSNLFLPAPFGASPPVAMDSGDGTASTDNVGMPVIHLKSAKALAILTAAKRVDLTDGIAKAWLANPAPGSDGITPFYGLRLTGIGKWEMIDLPRFVAETQFIRQFHFTTRTLDSYLNGRKNHMESGAPDNKFFAENSKLQDASDSYKHLANGADREQRMEASRELDSDLLGVADGDLATMQLSAFYGCNQPRVQEELAYRKAIRSELEDLGNNLVRLDNLARTR